MKEERLQILKMVEEGKISVDDAAKLLEAMMNTTYYDEQADNGPSFDERVKEFSKNAESFAKDLGGKMEGFYKDVEPRIKKATKVVVEKTAAVVDEIAKALNESIKNFDKDTCCNDDNECGCCCNDDEPREN